MKFKDWVVNNASFDQWLVEFMDVKSMSTQDINLVKNNVDQPDFDEYLASERCYDEAYNYIDRSEFFDGVYDDYDEDPNFFEDYDTIDPDDWLTENPEPDEADEHEEWKKEYKDVKENFRKAYSYWKKDMDEKRYEAERNMEEAISNYVYECIDERRSEWEFENGGKDDDSLKFNFQIDGDDFHVIFDKTNMNWKELSVENIWDVTFEGPNGTGLTHKNKNSTLIYKNLLLSIKKLMETEKVNGIVFVASNPHMALVYNQFFKQFLSKDFIAIDHFSFVKKEIIRDIKDPELKKEILEKIISSSRNTREIIKNVKTRKKELRNLITNPPIGDIFYMNKSVWPSDETMIVPFIVYESFWKEGHVYYKVFGIKGLNEQKIKELNQFSDDDKSIELINDIHNAKYFNFPKMTPPKFSPGIISVVKKLFLKLIQKQFPKEHEKIQTYL